VVLRTAQAVPRCSAWKALDTTAALTRPSNSSTIRALALGQEDDDDDDDDDNEVSDEGEGDGELPADDSGSSSLPSLALVLLVLLLLLLRGRFRGSTASAVLPPSTAAAPDVAAVVVVLSALGSLSRTRTRRRVGRLPSAEVSPDDHNATRTTITDPYAHTRE